MRKILTGAPFAIVAGIALVVLSAALATSPSTSGDWVGGASAAVALFAAIVCTGSAIRRWSRGRGRLRSRVPRE